MYKVLFYNYDYKIKLTILSQIKIFVILSFIGDKKLKIQSGSRKSSQIF